MIKCIIIDDEPLARTIVLEYLLQHPQIEVVQECNDGFEGVKAIMQHQPNLIFLDIQMPKINGFEMLELIETPPAVIFTTAFDEFAMKAFDNNAIDYLLKPFGQERFDKAIEKWLAANAATEANTVGNLTNERERSAEENSRVVVKTHNQIRIIPVHDIMYIEAYDDYVKIHTAEGLFVKKRTMASFENGLDAKEFVRIHRSYIIKLSELTKIEQPDNDSQVVLLKNGTRLPVSKSGYSKLKVALGMK